MTARQVATLAAQLAQIAERLCIASGEASMSMQGEMVVLVRPASLMRIATDLAGASNALLSMVSATPIVVEAEAAQSPTVGSPGRDG